MELFKIPWDDFIDKMGTLEFSSIYLRLDFYLVSQGPSTKLITIKLK